MRLAGNVRASGLREAYSDPRLREPDTYSSFVQRLVDADLVEIVRERWVEKIEVFFVAKKDGRLRMVCDCRLSNCHFAKPDRVRLCTAEALTRVELPAGSQLHIATADLKDAFYHFQLPLELRSYFGMRGLHAGELGVTELDGIAISASELVYPRLKVLPMGWSHALFWCQRLHQKIVGAVGAGPDSCLEDKVAVPNSECMHLEYVDNYVCLGTDQKQVEALSAAGVRALRQKGLVVHEIESVSTDQEPVKVLGWQFSGTKIQPVPLRVWRVRLGIEEILRIGNVPGRQLEKVVGHAAFICLGRRESLLSIFGETYTFIQRHYHMRHRLWSSVRRELQIFCCLLPLIWRDLSSEWSEQVTAVDASNWGLGATTADFSAAEVKQLGQFSERWRFESETFSKPRGTAFGVGVTETTDEAEAVQWASASGEPAATAQVPLDFGLGRKDESFFKPVPFEAVDRSWKVVGRYKWKRQEGMPVLEARATLFAIKHALRNVENVGKRHLVFSDSMSAICAIDKGRGKTRGLRRVTQQIGSLLLATGSMLGLRWLASEMNPADGPSRGSLFPSHPQRFLDGAAQTDSVAWQSASQGETKGETKGAKNKETEVFSGCVSSETSEKTAADSVGREPGQCLSGPIGPCPVSVNVGETEVLNWSNTGFTNVSKSDGPSLEQLSARDVLGGREFECCPIHGCGQPFLLPPFEISAADAAAHDQAMSAGMEETGPTNVKVAVATRSGVSDGGVLHQEKQGGGGPDDAPGHGSLPAARRTQQDSSGRCDPTGAWQPKTSMVLGSAPLGRGTNVEGPGVRRDSALRPRRTTSYPGVHLSGGQMLNTIQEREAFQCPLQRCDEDDGGSQQSPPHGQLGGTSRLQVAPCRRLPGLPLEVSKHERHSAEGALEGCVFDKTISERRAIAADAASVASKRKKRSNGGQPKSGCLAPQPALSRQPTTGPVFIEIFSGCGNLAKSVSRYTTWNVLLWDITLGNDYDLRSRGKRRMIGEWIRCGWVVGFHLGTPCESFTRARDVPPGPPPLRSDACPLGLSGLRPADQVKVITGNLWMRFSAWLLRLAIQFHLFATMENPQRSRIWLCPPMLSLMRKPCVRMYVTHYCYWGKPFKKATSFLAVNLVLSRLENAVCHASKRGLCQFSQCPHLQLCGKDESGQWRTRMAQPYPVKMCNAIAKCFHDAEVERIASRFQSKLA